MWTSVIQITSLERDKKPNAALSPRREQRPASGGVLVMMWPLIRYECKNALTNGAVGSRLFTIAILRDGQPEPDQHETTRSESEPEVVPITSGCVSVGASLGILYRGLHVSRHAQWRAPVPELCRIAASGTPAWRRSETPVEP